MWVRALADSDPACGGKAVALARLIAAGAQVPEGFAISSDVFVAFASIAGAVGGAGGDLDAVGHDLGAAAARIADAELPAELVAEVVRRAAALGGLLVVRSSATIEDGEAGAAAGVFSSRRALPIGELWPAIRAVWASALTPLAAAYARRRGVAIAIGVIVQRFVAGERVTVYTRPIGAPAGDELWIQRAGEIVKQPRGSDDPIARAALLAETAIGGAADVELVVEPGGTVWTVQARPLVQPVARARRPAPPLITAALLADGRRWTWDLAHNPDPLSPAQTGLVERVEAAGHAPWSLRVCGGYLYGATRAEVPAIALPHDVPARAAILEDRFADALGVPRSLDAALPPPPPLRDAIARYLAAYAIWAGELSPLIAAARAGHGAPGARPSAVEATLRAAATGELDEAAVIARLGPLAPCWDVAVPTFAERPGELRAAIARARALPAAPAAAAADPIADLAERDDLWFARAQAVVRGALRARAIELAIDPDDAPWLALDDLLAEAPLDRDDAHRRAAAARAAASRAAAWDMPLVIGGEPALTRPALHGVGSGARVVGRVVHYASLATAIAAGAGDVVVTRAVTPALAVLVTGCAALVSETGGLLDHGAALARELGITCVVGCTGAWSLLGDGALVAVDGDRGVVAVL